MSNEKSDNNSKNKGRSQKRHSAPSVSNLSKKNRYRSPFQPPVTSTTTASTENGTNGNQSDEYETPKKVNILEFKLIYFHDLFI